MAKLTVVPTPVGNLEDMTFRAIRVLKEADLVLAEDTRTTSVLFKHFDIQNKMQSHHKFNEHKTVEQLAMRIKAGENIALVSDAGTPAISDPGFMLVRECVRQGVEVECLPGATAFVPALVASGLPNEKFCFEGFLPQKKGRQTRLQELAVENRTMIIYESPFRLVKTGKFPCREKYQRFTKRLSGERWKKWLSTSPNVNLKEKLLLYWQEPNP